MKVIALTSISSFQMLSNKTVGRNNRISEFVVVQYHNQPIEKYIHKTMDIPKAEYSQQTEKLERDILFI